MGNMTPILEGNDYWEYLFAIGEDIMSSLEEQEQIIKESLQEI